MRAFPYFKKQLVRQRDTERGERERETERMSEGERKSEGEGEREKRECETTGLW